MLLLFVCDVFFLLSLSCEEFLRLLQRASSTPAMMTQVAAVDGATPSSGSSISGASSATGVDALVAAWMQSSKVQSREISTSKTESKVSEKDRGSASKGGSAIKPRKSVTVTVAAGVVEDPPCSPTNREGASAVSFLSAIDSSSSSSSSGGADKAHVVLLLPLCLDLVLSLCAAQELKAVAVALIK